MSKHDQCEVEIENVSVCFTVHHSMMVCAGLILKILKYATPHSVLHSKLAS